MGDERARPRRPRTRREWDTPDGAKRQAVDITADSIVPTPRSAGATSTAAVATSDEDIEF